MLVGIKLSNLSREQKKIERQKKILLTKFAECLISSTRQNYSFAECQVVALGKHLTP